VDKTRAFKGEREPRRPPVALLDGFMELESPSSITEEQVSRALFTLVQHDLVVTWPFKSFMDAKLQKRKLGELIVKEQDKTKTSFQTGFYSADPRTALNILFRSRFRGFVQDTFGDEAALLFEEILLIGSFSKEDIVDHFTLRVLCRYGDESLQKVEFYKEIIEKLESGDFGGEEEASDEKSPTRLTGKQALHCKHGRQIRKRVGKVFDKLAFEGVIIEREKLTFEMVELEINERLQESRTNMKPNLRRRKFVKGQEIPFEKEEENAVWYQPNWSYFLYRAMGDAVAKYWGDQMSCYALERIIREQAVKARLLPERFQGYKPLPRIRNAPPEPEDVFTPVMLSELSEDTRTMMVDFLGGGTNEEVREKYTNFMFELADLSRDSRLGMRLVKADPDKYAFAKDSTRFSLIISFQASFAKVKQTTAQSMLHAQFGPDAITIINMLSEKGALEEQDIVSFAMMAPKKGRSLLHQMKAKGFIVVEELSKRADLNPIYTKYLYRVERRSVAMKAAEAAHQILLNLREAQRLLREHYSDVAYQGQPEETSASHPRWEKYARAWVKLLRHADCMQETVLMLSAFEDYHGLPNDLIPLQVDKKK